MAEHIKVPSNLTVLPSAPYPPYSKVGNMESVFMVWYYQNRDRLKDCGRIYIPINWTGVYVNRRHGLGDLSDVQKFLDGLDRSKKYFTVVQFVRGIINDIKDLDIVVCGTSTRQFFEDKPIDVPCNPDVIIPLNPVTFPQRHPVERDILASFVGNFMSDRGMCRNKLKILQNKEGFYIRSLTSADEFIKIMERTKFCIAPRGYGPTSFRLSESFYFGCVPVYIWKHVITLPFEDKIEWNKCVIFIEDSDDVDVEKVIRDNEHRFDEMVSYGNKILNELLIHDRWPEHIYGSLINKM